MEPDRMELDGMAPDGMAPDGMEPGPLPTTAFAGTALSVVIPVFNEAEAVASVIEEIPRGLVQEIIVADGGSTDGTQDIARAAGARVLDAGRGYGRACQAGAQAALGAVIVFLDGDGADRGDLLRLIAEPVLAGTHDLVLASRTSGKRDPGSMLWHQVLAGRVAGWGIGALYGVRYSDMCAFRAIRRDALIRLDMQEMTYGWNIEMQMKAARGGLRIKEIPMPYRCRMGGTSKVAGSLPGTLRAGGKIVSTFARVASQRSAGAGWL
jgi:glycosyltransferase involved in cell wall biosynthesis